MNLKVQDNAPSISVVIPLYNKENEIKRAIYSVLNQSYKPYEIIVVDDESTDNSVNIVKSINDSKIKIISQKNQGEFGARNTGIKTASGDYIAFLDGDDEWLPEYLEAIVSLILEYNDAGLYCTSRLYMKINSETNGRHTFGFKEGDRGIINSPFMAFAKSHMAPMSCSSSVVPKRVFNELGIFASKRGAGYDWEMWTRIMLNYPIAYDAEYLVLIHIESENRLSNIPSNVQLKEHPVIEYIKNNETCVERYLIENKDDIELYIDYINITLSSCWVLTNGNGANVRNIIKNINNRNKFTKEILYLMVESYAPIRLRFIISKLATWINRNLT